MGERVYLKSLGCKVNQVEIRDIATELLSAGIDLTDSLDDATLVVVNTCSVTVRSDAKVRKEIRRALHAPQVAQVIATGCSAVIQGDELRRIDERVTVEPEKDHVVRTIIEGLDDVSHPSEKKKARLHTSGLHLPGNLARTRANLKISDGCENYCSYCIVPYARGGVRAVPREELAKKARALVDSGVNEIVLSGINIGIYHDDGLDLTGLIRYLATESGIHRLRLSSIEPNSINEALLTLLEETELVCEHLHIPLQSGSDKVITDMNRHYSREQYCALIERLRSIDPCMAIHTDVIVGYPTETDSDFDETLELAEELEFAAMHLFKFSARPGTVAADLTPLAPLIIEERFKRLQDIAKLNAQRYREMRLSSERPLELLIERVANGKITATSREHVSIMWEESECPFPNLDVGDIVVTLGRECT
ncbi:MAG: MiaB/RimO family radical SAM methylthiotransferase [Coriobacteriia bacterium]|nr:MiaB/RimO family radical SAM methylthiotransferase [Coriobacteriia bacterium]